VLSDSCAWKQTEGKNTHLEKGLRALEYALQVGLSAYTTQKISLVGPSKLLTWLREGGEITQKLTIYKTTTAIITNGRFNEDRER